MPLRLAAPPARSGVMHATTRNRFSEVWRQWIQDLVDNVSSRVQSIASVSLPSQKVDAGLVTIRTPETLPAGLYRATATMLPYEGLSATCGAQLAIGWTYQSANWEVVLCNRAFVDGLDGDTGSVLMKVTAGTDIKYRLNLQPGTATPSYGVHVDILLERVR
jgi:hypothetical protein